MHTTKLRKVGGSVMLAVPPAILDLCDLQPGHTVSLVVHGQVLEIRHEKRPRYTLAELLEASDYSAPPSSEERDWLDAPQAGRELI